MKHKIAAIIAASALVATLAACSPNNEYQERKEKQDAITLDNSLGIENQKERLRREEDPNTTRFVYLMQFSEVVGYYVIKGSVSSSSTQLAPENEIVQPFTGGDRYVVDSAKDNGTYGNETGGNFFFTADGILIETTLDYIQSDSPIAIYREVPKLG